MILSQNRQNMTCVQSLLWKNKKESSWFYNTFMGLIPEQTLFLFGKQLTLKRNRKYKITPSPEWAGFLPVFWGLGIKCSKQFFFHIILKKRTNFLVTTLFSGQMECVLKS